MAFKNFKSALSNEFMQVNNMVQNPSDSKLKLSWHMKNNWYSNIGNSNLQSKESGAVTNN